MWTRVVNEQILKTMFFGNTFWRILHIKTKVTIESLLIGFSNLSHKVTIQYATNSNLKMMFSTILLTYHGPHLMLRNCLERLPNTSPCSDCCLCHKCMLLSAQPIPFACKSQHMLQIPIYYLVSLTSIIHSLLSTCFLLGRKFLVSGSCHHKTQPCSW